MYVVAAASRLRCLAVGAGVTAALWGAAAVLLRTLTAGRSATPDLALARLCLAALVLAVAWAWLQALAGVADAWRGTRPGAGSGTVRRFALAACGVAVAGVLAAPAQAEGPDVLTGLPLPERAEGPGQPPRHRVVVRTGDTLWALAARELDADATDREITERWLGIYAANRALVGPDPDLIRPGQVLRLTKEKP